MKYLKSLSSCCLLAICTSTQLVAQISNSTLTPKVNHRIATMLQKQEEKKHSSRVAERTTSVPAERLIAKSIYDFYPPDSIMGLMDTTSFFYSGSRRGSQFNYNSVSFHNDDWIYGFIFDYYYGRTIGTLWLGVTPKALPNYFAQVLCDSAHQYFYRSADTGGHHFISCDTVSTYETYDGNSNILSADFHGSSFTRNTDLFTWDGNNNNVYTLYLNYYTGLDTNGCTFSIFNAAGQLLEDSIEYGPPLKPSERLIYSYDGLGNLVHISGYSDSMGVWLETRRWDLTYNSDNFIKKDSFSMKFIGASTWVTDRIDSFGYTAGVNYITYHRTDSYNDSTYAIVTGRSIYSKHVDASGLPDTLYWSSKGYYPTNPTLLGPIYKQAFTYDSYRNPVMAYEFHYSLADTSTGAGYYNVSPDITTHYYYESYASTAGISHMNAATAEDATFVPNPSTGIYRLTVNNKTPQAYVIVCNELGCVVYRQVFTGGSAQVDLSTLPGGVYFATVFDDLNHAVKTQKLVKLE